MPRAQIKNFLHHSILSEKLLFDKEVDEKNPTQKGHLCKCSSAVSLRDQQILSVKSVLGVSGHADSEFDISFSIAGRINEALLPFYVVNITDTKFRPKFIGKLI